MRLYYCAIVQQKGIDSFKRNKERMRGCKKCTFQITVEYKKILGGCFFKKKYGSLSGQRRNMKESNFTYKKVPDDAVFQEGIA